MKRRVFVIAGAFVATGAVLSPGVARAGDPSVSDCLAASDASLKAANEHKLLTERTQLLICASASCPADIRKDCASHVDDVNAQIPTILFAAKDATGADTGAVKVSMDGNVLAERLEGNAIAIDPGEHTFTFEMAGQPPITRKLVLQEGQRDRRELVTFGNPGAGSAAPPAAVAPGPETPPADSGGMGTQKILAIVAGGVGVVGLGLGTLFGLEAMSKKNDAQSACPDKCASSDGVNKWSDAASAGNVATVGFIIGGVGLIGGAVLWFTAPGAGAAKTQVGLGPEGLRVRGTW